MTRSSISACERYPRVVARSPKKAQAEIWERKNRDKIAAINLIREYSSRLAVRQRQVIFTDHYGMKNIKKWESEMNYFIKTVLVEHLGDRSYILNEFDVVQEIEQAIENCPPPEWETFRPDMSPLAYECMCADILIANGWNARTTKASGDQGVDVIADCGGVRVVLQCKLYSNPVGNGAVQEIFAAMTHEMAHYAAVVTNAGYTSGARQLASTTNVALLHHDDLKNWSNSLSVKSRQRMNDKSDYDTGMEAETSNAAT
jgi:restriction system protein